MNFARLLALIQVRLQLLIRQKLGWGSAAAMVLATFVARIASGLSWIHPGKVYWDFSLGLSFIMTTVLALFLGSQLYHEERGRRTLHLVLSAGVSRREWIIANALSIWIFLAILQILWIPLSAFLGFGFEGDFFTMAAQAQLAALAESIILVFLGVLFSLWVRPMLAFFASLILVIFLHSVDSLERIFTNEQYGRFVDATGPAIALWISRALPPLQWFDLRLLVGYQEAVDALLLLKLFALSAIWSGLLALVAALKFERMDF